MKKKFEIKKILLKKEGVTIMALAIIFCAGLVVYNVKSEEIPLHDGDVLVDSLNVATQPQGSDNDTAGDKPTDPQGNEQGEVTGGSFADMRASLDMDRNEIIAKLDKTLNSSENEAEKSNASAEKDKLVNTMKQEVEIEGLIASKSLPESFVLITDSSVTVTVDKQELDQNTVAKICEIVMRETGRTADKIIIQSNY